MLVLITEDRGQTFRQVDESALMKRVDIFENDDVRLEATEYCLRGCTGQAHVVDRALGDGCFCDLNVHRSAHGVVKRWPQEVGAVAASLT